MNANTPWRFLEGSVIQEQYHLERLLGAGGYGGVYRASEVVRDRVIRQLAVKIIFANDNQIARQLQELQVALSVKHPNLLSCFGCGEATITNNKVLYLLMELAKESLQQRLDRTALNEDETRTLLQDIATGLIYLHDSNKANGSLVHRDLNPGNIFWVENRWKIGDFGITRQVGNNRPGVSTNLVGRPGFAPPESYQGTYTPATDMWSLGVITVYALHRTLPFNAQTTEELRDRVTKCDLAVPALSSPFREIVQNCLLLEPRQRWTAQQVYNALQPPQVSEPKVTTTRNYTENLKSGVTLEMVAIPGGSFLMGSPDGEGYDWEHPQHRVNVPSFYMGKYPVTNAQWKAVMGTTPLSNIFGNLVADSNKPVIGVSWNDAQEFCQKLSSLSSRKYRLPSEAEWEYACRAGTSTKFYFGDDEKQLQEYGFYSGNAIAVAKGLLVISSGIAGIGTGNLTHIVGQHKPNAFSLYDMHGNVWEWCEDKWHKNYNGAPTDGSAWVNENTSSEEKKRLLRGGSWFDSARICRSACRYRFDADVRGSSLGFRVVCS